MKNGSTVLIAAKPEMLHDVRGDDFCTVMQSVDSKLFKGKRTRLAGELRTKMLALARPSCSGSMVPRERSCSTISNCGDPMGHWSERRVGTSDQLFLTFPRKP